MLILFFFSLLNTKLPLTWFCLAAAGALMRTVYPVHIKMPMKYGTVPALLQMILRRSPLEASLRPTHLETESRSIALTQGVSRCIL